jgi:hypothetical protein
MRIFDPMRLRCKICFVLFVLLAVLATPATGSATSCTTQSALPGVDRDALSAAGGRLATAAAQQDYATLQAALLPAVAADWENMHGIVEQSGSLLKGGEIQLRNLYLLDATSLTAPTDTQFFCSNTSGSITVTLNLHSLPPGRYALVLAESKGSPNLGQLSLILAWDGDGPTPGWKLGGITIHPGSLDGNDGVWWWTRARELARPDSPKYDPWSAYYSYEMARALLAPVDFLTSPNLDKLEIEQAQIKIGEQHEEIGPNKLSKQLSPQNAFPITLPDTARTWKIVAVLVDPVLLHADLAVVYEANPALTDPAAERTEAIAALSALLKAHPELRQSFHGLWAYASKEGKRNPVLEMPMEQIP